MCTVVVLIRPENPWPVLIAANRDEMADRPSKPPARHWEDRPDVVAGLDELSGGTWLGLNDYGVFACVLNRVGTLGPSRQYRTRGELPLEALDHADAESAFEALRHLDPSAYRGFNLLIADRKEAYWLYGSNDEDGAAVPHVGGGRIQPGLGMITAYGLNDNSSARIRFHRPRFETAAVPDPESGDWAAWQALLASTEYEEGSAERGSMLIGDGTGFGTVSASLIALPHLDRSGVEAQFLHAPGRPGQTSFASVL
ncbi:MAG: NRDE family protein [Magnetovibrionaceae bacterium]